MVDEVVELELDENYIPNKIASVVPDSINDYVPERLRRFLRWLWARVFFPVYRLLKEQFTPKLVSHELPHTCTVALTWRKQSGPPLSHLAPQMLKRFLAVAIVELALAWSKRAWWQFRPYVTTSPTKAPMSRILKSRQQMMAANDYDEYSQAAHALDRDSGLDEYKADPESPYFNLSVLNARIEQYSTLREKGDISGLMFYLRSHLMRGGFGIGDPRLWASTHIGTKTCLYRYVNEVTRCSHGS